MSNLGSLTGLRHCTSIALLFIADAGRLVFTGNTTPTATNFGACDSRNLLFQGEDYERKFSRWSLESRLARSASLEDHVRDVLNQSLTLAAQIRQVGHAHTAFIQLVGWFHKDYPGFGLDSSIIAGLAELNVGIDCDFYYLYSHEREDSE